MLTEPITARFACYDCDGPSFTVKGALTDNSEVVCGSCGATFGGWKDFLSKLGATRCLEGALKRERTALSCGQSASPC